MTERKRIPARETFYNGIKMRSRLEAKFAGILDGLGVQWQYEGPAYGSGKTQYLPDFVVGTAPEVWFIEVKPYLAWEEDAFEPDLILDRMRVILTAYEDEPYKPTLAIASPMLGDFLYCLAEDPPSQRWERGFAAWFRDTDAAPGTPAQPYPLFGFLGSIGALISHAYGGMLPMDWSWK